MVGQFFPWNRFVHYKTSGWSPQDIQSADVQGFVRLSTNNSSCSLDEEPLIISADGACHLNGEKHAEEAHGVFVGHSGIVACWNESARLRSKATSQRAELVAAMSVFSLKGIL